MDIPIVRNILEANDRLATQLRQKFAGHQVLTLNLISSPGAGKTTLLERTLADLKNTYRMAVIEGDLMTDNDARRVAAAGAQAVQINTQGGCHLDSAMVLEAVEQIDLTATDILFVENVGNLVCPVEFDLGEDAKVALLSVTEGDDKPEKYPLLFHEARILLLNKTDLLPHVDFDMDKAARHARALNRDIEILPVSCRTRQGLEAWYDWLRTALEAKRAS